MTKNHIPGGLEQQGAWFFQSGGRESDVKVRQGHGLSGGSGEVLLASQPLGAAGSPRCSQLIDASP